jgi:predicted transcriptional regulator
MVKTTVYLDAAIAVTLRQLSQQEGRSQAELIRDALAEFAKRRKRPPIPGAGEFDSGESAVSRNAEKVLHEASAQGKWRKQRSRGADR